jgi:hypothetical protein
LLINYIALTPFAPMGEMRNTFRILVRKTEGKRLPYKHKHGWENNIQMDL